MGVKYDSSTPPAPENLYVNTNEHWNPNWDDVKNGLTSAEHKERLAKYGPNALPEKKTNPIIEYLQNFWGPMPIMIWFVIVLLICEILILCKEKYPDLVMCCVLQFVNGNIKYYTSQTSKGAIAALKSKMAPKCFVKRDGDWVEEPAKELVPGDVIQVNIGMIIPADIRFGPCENVQSDQAALTGESLPTSKALGDAGYSSSVIKRGEGEGIIVGTGLATEMGKAAGLVAKVVKKSRYDFILFWVATYLLCLAGCCMTIQFIYSVIKGDSVFEALVVVVAILIGALPVAMHVVCMTIMAFGAYRLTKHGAVVSELTAVEELSGMTILCSDKTGTLTYNRLEVIKHQCEVYGDATLEDLYFCSALGCKRTTEGQDAIDYCLTNEFKKNFTEKAKVFDSYETVQFVPFDPVSKRTEAKIQGPGGESFAVTKGAPQVILAMSAGMKGFAKVKEQAETTINSLAKRGYRTLGVARNNESGGWDMIGLLAIADPPRKDTKAVIKAANGLGIKVIMITGDQTAIAKEVGKQIGIGENMMNAALLGDIDKLPFHYHEELPYIIERCDGFAEVFPEHKFKVVAELQKLGHIVGMTGDGVNDAPALALANVGIAVSGATDAARAAASIFLQHEGLSVIISAIMRSKKVFERVKNYIIYRSATSLRLMGFFFCCTMFIQPMTQLPGYDSLGRGDFGNDWRHDCGKSVCDHSKTDRQKFDEAAASRTCQQGFQDKVLHLWANKCFNSLCARKANFPNSGIDDLLEGNCGTENPFVPLEETAVDQWEFPGNAKYPVDYRDPTSVSAMSGGWKWDSKFHQELGDIRTNTPWDSHKDSIPNLWNCVNKLRHSDLHIQNKFSTPTMVVIVLTLLNDFTVITIAFDHVEISKRPDKWYLFRNIAIGTVIGANTLIWSIVMFLFMLASMDPESPTCTDWNICLSYPEVLTGAFLQLSLCARLARTNARTEGWFCTLSLHRSVVMTMTFSIFAATILGFTWPFCEGYYCTPDMDPLPAKMVALILIWQIPVHIVRDIFKQFAYKYFNTRDAKEREEKRLEIERHDNAVNNILRDLAYQENENQKSNSTSVNSVTLQSVARERSNKFTHMTEEEKFQEANKIVKAASGGLNLQRLGSKNSKNNGSGNGSAKEVVNGTGPEQIDVNLGGGEYN